jgi:hypothetical protein
MMVLENRPPARRVTFGESRAGFKKLHDLIAMVPTIVYRNHHDIIAHLPFSGLVEHYVDSATPTDVNVAPHGSALLWGPFAPLPFHPPRQGAWFPFRSSRQVTQWLRSKNGAEQSVNGRSKF